MGYNLSLGKIWAVYTITVFVISFLATSLISMVVSRFITVSTFIPVVGAIIIAVIVLIKAIRDGWVQVPENWEWVMEFLGRHQKCWKAGLYIAFPYFGFMQVRNKVFMGEQMMELYMNEAKTDGYGEGVVDFVDGSAPVDAVVYFTPKKSYKATYNISDLYGSIGEKIDGAIRAYLGNYKIDEANKLKVQFNLARVLNGYVLGRDADDKIIETDDKAKDELDKENAHKTTDLWKEISENWGVEINSIAVSDIVLSDEIIKIREQKLLAEKTFEVAEITKKTTIVNAEAKKQATVLEGEGLASQINDLGKQEIKGTDATGYLIDLKKWENVGDKTVIIDSSGTGIAGAGVAFGAGMKNT